jgi:hypothetical protein
MSQESTKYSLTSNLGSYEGLEFCFDFLDSGLNENNISATGEASNWTGVLNNASPASGVENYRAFVLNASGSSEIDASGEVDFFINESGFNLNESNLMIPTENLNLSDCSIIIDFEFIDEISSGILFGSFKKEEVQLPDSSYITGSKGYNIGITDRGHLFMQGFSEKGDFVEVFYEKELSKRNVISINSSENSLNVSFMDFFENQSVDHEKELSGFYTSSPDYMYIGGTERTFKEEDKENTTFNGYLKSIYILNKGIGGQKLFDLEVGFLSTYEFVSGASEFIEKPYFSGEYITYMTGITGYDCIISSGEHQIGRTISTHEYLTTGVLNIKEGETGEVLVDGELLEVGFLSDAVSGSYNPTGQGAYDTLGLQNYNIDISGYEDNLYFSGESGYYPIYTCNPLTGELDEISGIEQVYGTTGFYIYEPDSSGIVLELDSEKFKKDYIYYNGERL